MNTDLEEMVKEIKRRNGFIEKQILEFEKEEGKDFDYDSVWKLHEESRKNEELILKIYELKL